MIGLYIFITVHCLDNHGVDLDPFSRVCGAVVLLDRARLELWGPDNPSKIWSERLIVGDRDSGIGAIMLSLICIKHHSGILTSVVCIQLEPEVSTTRQSIVPVAH